MHHHAWVLSFSLLLSTAALAKQSLQAQLDTLIATSLPNAHIGVMIKEANSEKILYQHHATQLLNPASNIKLITAAAALYQLGPNYRYQTTLAQDKKNLFLGFSGSPSLTTDNLTAMFSTLKEHTIQGNIIFDTSRMQPPYYASGVSFDDIGWYYEAPSTAVILNQNKVMYEATSAPTLGMPIQLTLKKNQPTAVHIINDVITVDAKQAKYHCNFNIEIQKNNTLHVYGCLAQRKEPKILQFAIPDPELFAKQLVIEALQTHHITLHGQITSGRMPTDAKIITSYQSKPLVNLIKYMLVESDNLYADSITKLLAKTVTHVGTYQQGVYAIKKILKEHTHMDMTLLDLADGHGTRYNLTTPEQFVILLDDLYHNPELKPLILTSLPQMGHTGTLKERMKDTALRDIVLAKTGSMHDISALSGYMMLPGDRNLIFSIITNGVTNISAARTLEENILLSVYNAYNLQNTH